MQPLYSVWQMKTAPLKVKTSCPENKRQDRERHDLSLSWDTCWPGTSRQTCASSDMYCADSGMYLQGLLEDLKLLLTLIYCVRFNIFRTSSPQVQPPDWVFCFINVDFSSQTLFQRLYAMKSYQLSIISFFPCLHTHDQLLCWSYN